MNNWMILIIYVGEQLVGGKLRVSPWEKKRKKEAKMLKERFIESRVPGNSISQKSSILKFW